MVICFAMPNMGKMLPPDPDTIWGIAVTAHKIHSGKEECYNLSIPSNQFPGE